MTTEQIDKLKRIKELFDNGVLDEKEFASEKERILSQSSQQLSPEQENGLSAQEKSQANEEDKPSIGWNILSFLLGIVGVIIYFATKDRYPIRAKSILKWSLIGIAVSLVYWIITVLVGEFF